MDGNRPRRERYRSVRRVRLTAAVAAIAAGLTPVGAGLPFAFSDDVLSLRQPSSRSENSSAGSNSSTGSTFAGENELGSLLQEARVQMARPLANARAATIAPDVRFADIPTKRPAGLRPNADSPSTDQIVPPKPNPANTASESEVKVPDVRTLKSFAGDTIDKTGSAVGNTVYPELRRFEISTNRQTIPLADYAAVDETINRALEVNVDDKSSSADVLSGIKRPKSADKLEWLLRDVATGDGFEMLGLGPKSRRGGSTTYADLGQTSAPENQLPNTSVNGKVTLNDPGVAKSGTPVAELGQPSAILLKPDAIPLKAADTETDSRDIAIVPVSVAPAKRSPAVSAKSNPEPPQSTTAIEQLPSIADNAKAAVSANPSFEVNTAVTENLSGETMKQPFGYYSPMRLSQPVPAPSPAAPDITGPKLTAQGTTAASPVDQNSSSFPELPTPRLEQPSVSAEENHRSAMAIDSIDLPKRIRSQSRRNLLRLKISV